MNAEATQVENAESTVKAARILVVEDERIVARSLRKQLTALGYEVVATVPSGEEAIEQARDFRPDLVLMDINLEGSIDGVIAAATIRERYQLPVVYLTAYSNREILARAKVTQPFGYILKPYQERELQVVIEIAIYKHRMERQQQELAEQLRQSKMLEALGRLAGGVAHSFNNLMTIVLGHSSIMLDTMKPVDPFFANTQEIKRAASRTALLTQNLLAFGRKQNLKLFPVNLNAVITRITRILQHLKAGVHLSLRLQPALGLTNSDEEQLEEAVITLVRSACNAMPNGGSVTIETANVELGTEYTHDHPEVRPGPYVRLTVSDTRLGIDQEAISHLFEPFYLTELGVGAGLGLAAIYGFVKQCSGDIDVRSNPDIGATLDVYLPREEKAKLSPNNPIATRD